MKCRKANGLGTNPSRRSQHRRRNMRLANRQVYQRSAMRIFRRSPICASAGAGTSMAAAASIATGGARRLRSGHANGIVNNVVAAMVNIAATQPMVLMIACFSGANTNWPNEPLALIYDKTGHPVQGWRQWSARC